MLNNQPMTLGDVLLVIFIVLAVFLVLYAIISWIAMLTSERNELRKKVEQLKAKEEALKYRIIIPASIDSEKIKDIDKNTLFINQEWLDACKKIK